LGPLKGQGNVSASTHMTDEQLPSIDDYLAILKRRKWQLILPIVLLAPIGVVVALTLPPVYRSTAIILIEQQSVNRELLARTEEELRSNSQAVRTSQEQQLYLETELDKLDAHLGPGISVDGRKLPVSPEARLRELKAELAADRERYSPKHPDVVRIKRTIAELERQIAQAPDRGGSEAVPKEQADNPAYVQLRSRLETTRLEIRGLLEARKELKSLLDEYEQRLVEGPSVEREYRDLSRDYDNAVAKYREVKDKEMEAELGKALETERKGERFTLIEPPVVPSEPEKPNRPAIMMLGVVLSFAGGFGNMALREILDKGIRGARKVQLITQAPPLAVIPFIPTTADRRRRIRKRAVMIGTMVLLIGAGIAAVHFLLMPLDLLWFTLVRWVGTHLSAVLGPESAGGLLWNA